MLKVLKKIWPPKNRRKVDRVPTHSLVQFKILDSRNPSVRSRVLQGEILDLSEEGLCIGTNTVQIDGMHIFHHPSTGRSKLELEVALSAGQSALKTVGEVRWYRKTEGAGASTYRVGVNWESLTKEDLEALRKFLKTQEKNKV
jgi:hypothetical protein